MAGFLTDTLNEAFGSAHRVKAKPTTKVVTTFGGAQQEVIKGRDGLWSFTLDGERHSNSLLRDLIHQIENDFGGTVERVSA